MDSESPKRFCPRCGLATNGAHCPTDGTGTLLRGVTSEAAALMQPGTVLAGRYRIQAVLGRGGFGVAYLAEHTSSGQELAVKVLALEPDAASEPIIQRFFQEAQVTRVSQACIGFRCTFGGR